MTRYYKEEHRSPRIRWYRRKAFGGAAADQPVELQPTCDVTRFGGTAAVDQPRQRAPVTVKIGANAIQPFGLRRSHQPHIGECGLSAAIAGKCLRTSSRSRAALSSSAAYARTVSSI